MLALKLEEKPKAIIVSQRIIKQQLAGANLPEYDPKEFYSLWTQSDSS